MPRFDGTGPWGRGPLSGWGRGFCGYDSGLRRFFSRGFNWGLSPYKDRKEALIEYKKTLEDELKELDKELGNLK